MGGRGLLSFLLSLLQVIDLSQRLAGGGSFLDDALGGFVGGMASFAEALNPVTLLGVWVCVSVCVCVSACVCVCV